MSAAMATTMPTRAMDLAFRDVGTRAAVTTEDASARGSIWQIEFHAGKVKLVIQSRSGLLFFDMQPDATIYLEVSR